MRAKMGQAAQTDQDIERAHFLSIKTGYCLSSPYSVRPCSPSHTILVTRNSKKVLDHTIHYRITKDGKPRSHRLLLDANKEPL